MDNTLQELGILVASEKGATSEELEMIKLREWRFLEDLKDQMKADSISTDQFTVFKKFNEEGFNLILRRKRGFS